MARHSRWRRGSIYTRPTASRSSTSATIPGTRDSYTRTSRYSSIVSTSCSEKSFPARRARLSKSRWRCCRGNTRCRPQLRKSPRTFSSSARPASDATARAGPPAGSGRCRLRGCAPVTSLASAASTRQAFALTTGTADATTTLVWVPLGRYLWTRGLDPLDRLSLRAIFFLGAEALRGVILNKKNCEPRGSLEPREKFLEVFLFLTS